ncbi:MAG: DUF3187 family protein [Xanthomonadales bacterium]|nr:DUF3187 family protein [Xanthomonadales bacterium]
MLADKLVDPFVTTNQNPFVQIYGLPAAQSAELTSVGELSTGLQLDVSSNFAVGNQVDEAVSIDGETHRANLQVRYGLTDDIEMGIDVPYLGHKRGSLDGLIERWHDFWGLPTGNRPNYPRDQLDYSYRKNGQMLAAVTESQSGIGDVRLRLGYQLAANEKRQWVLRTLVKLPTGDAEQLLGSGSTDIAASINFTDQSLMQKYNLTWHGSAGLLWMGSGEVLDQQRKDWVAYGSLTLGWLATQNFSLKLQLDAHTAFYDSALTELGNESAQLVFGGAVRLGKHWMLDLAVSEDIVVDTASDVVFHIGIKGADW